MTDQGPKGSWVAPEDVPDPIALRAKMAARDVAPPPAPPEQEPPRGIGSPTFDLGTLDPLDAPAAAPPRQPASPAQAVQDDLAAGTSDATLEPPPPLVARVEAITDPPGFRLPAAGRGLPAAVWVGGTLLLVAVLSMGIRMFTTGAGAAPEPSTAPAVPVTRPPVEASSDPVPVDAAPAPVETTPRPRRGPRRELPPQASVRPIGERAPPAAVVRPLTPPAAASLEPDVIAPKNPWTDVEP